MLVGSAEPLPGLDAYVIMPEIDITRNSRMNLNNRPVSIIGAARSGLAAARSLARIGAKVLLSDIRTLDALQAHIASAGLPDSVVIETGGHSEKVLDADFIILSPGVKTDIPILHRAAELKIPVHSEIEIAYRLSKGTRLVVTGSNGKTTTTTLLGRFCESFFPKVFVGGNIGVPMMEFALDTHDEDAQVLEVSSFQLETISEFTPNIAMITNFFENHLDRYSSYDSYRLAKERIAMNMNRNHWLVLNADQEAMHNLARRVECRIGWFGWEPGDRRPAVTVEGDHFIFISPDGRKSNLFHDSVVKLIGRHNRENIMAAALAAILAGVPTESLEDTVASFKGVEHRLEWVAKVDGVSFINDSKGTNCAASMTAVRSCPEGVILLAGGRDKGTDLAGWVETIHEHAKGVVLFGEARERFRSALEGIVPIKIAVDLKSAFDLAVSWAESGNIVLLSPACSSYDQFSDYEERGRYFKSLVRDLMNK